VINVDEKQKHVGELAINPQHCFRRLYRVICEEAWLTEAWKRIRKNKGSKTAGVDGQTKDDVDEALIKRLAEKLRKEEYQPTPVRRTYIPKANGKRRPLGIPTIQDRIVQSALKMILEPIYEQEFRNSSHGFRPRRSCITTLRDVANRFPRSTWIIEGDITGCYDNIHHGRLLSILRRRIRDEKLLGLMNNFLKAGYLEQWVYHRTYSGTPQGGIITPPTILLNGL
jgi:group II intron reverse transcriptase/maturase